MKRKLFAVVMVICMIAAMGLTGCGSTANPYEGLNFEEYVKLAEYKGLERSEIKVSVSDEEVQTQIESNLESTAETVEKTEGKVKEGDTANIDYEGKKDGVAFDGGTAEGYDLEIGSGTFIEGFEEGLIGKEIGGTYDLNLTFPEDYSSEELAGQDVVFTVKINSVKAQKAPEYTVEWVKENSDVDTKKDYEALVKDQLTEEKEETAKNNIMAELWNQVVEGSTITQYPQEIVDGYIAEIEAQYELMAETYGMELEALWEQEGIESQEAFDAKTEAAAQAYVKEQMIMYNIAEAEGLTYTDEEAEEIRTAIDEAGFDEETFRQQYGQDIESYIDSALTFSKVSEFIYDNAVIK